MSQALPPRPRIASRTRLIRGPSFDYEQPTPRDANGLEHTRRHVRHLGAAAILPLRSTPEGRPVVFGRNFRTSVGDCLLELPAGTLDAGESPEVCAARELIEETGYRAATVVPLGRFHPSSGLSDEVLWAFLATDLHPVVQTLEPGELLEVSSRRPRFCARPGPAGYPTRRACSRSFWSKPGACSEVRPRE